MAIRYGARTGIGRGKGMKSGGRRNRNTRLCSRGGVGYGRGGGRGKDRGRT